MYHGCFSFPYQACISLGQGISAPIYSFTSSYTDNDLLATRFSILVRGNGEITSIGVTFDMGSGALGISNGALTYYLYLFVSHSTYTDGTLANSDGYEPLLAGPVLIRYPSMSTYSYKTYTINTPLDNISVNKGDRIIPVFCSAKDSDNTGFAAPLVV